jgi:hypothetical protein
MKSPWRDTSTHAEFWQKLDLNQPEAGKLEPSLFTVRTHLHSGVKSIN